MWPAASLEMIFRRAGEVTDYRDRLGQRLVSMVFAPPAAALWQELRYSVGHLDAQTGNNWDLFFIGVPAVAKHDNPHAGQDWSRHFQPDVFQAVAAQVQREHAEALTRDGRLADGAWRHSGGSDLVSLMAYDGEPDWLSLNAVRLDKPGGAPRISLAEAAARQTSWISGGIDEELSPGLGPRSVRLTDLDHGLSLAAATAGAVATGVLGNYVYAMLQSLR